MNAIIRYQTIDGFGACTYLYSDIDSIYDTPEFQDWYRRSFSGQELICCRQEKHERLFGCDRGRFLFGLPALPSTKLARALELVP